ncbi:MAG TPA: PAS domain-containing protein [Flavobacterium sp.]|jgi:PAS domain S-box-containing protein
MSYHYDPNNHLTHEMLQGLLSQAPAAVAVIIGPEHTYIQANLLYQQLFRRTENELLGHTVAEAFPELIGEGTIEIFDEAYRTGIPYQATEYPVMWDRNRDGELVQGYFNFIAQPIRDASGEVFALLIHVFEVTEQIMSRRKIEESEKEFRQIADSLPQIVWTCRPDGYVDYYNKQWYEFTGFSEEFGDSSWFKILHPDDLQPSYESFYNSIQSGLPYQIYYRFKDRSEEGRYRWFIGRANPVRDLDGKIVKWFGTCTDIDDQMAIAESLERKIKKRTASLEQLTRSFEHAEIISRMGNFRLDFISRKMTWSRNLYSLFGVDPDTFAPTVENVLEFVHPDDRARVTENTRKMIESQRSHPVTFRITDAKGEIKYLFGSGKVMTDDDGRDFMFGTFQDVTAEKLQEISLHRKNQELEKVNAELESFAYISSHDLQEPLRKIQTFTSMIMESDFDNLSEMSKKFFTKIQNSALRMQTLIKDLLSYSRTSTAERAFEKTHLSVIVNELKEDFKEELKEHHGTIEAEDLCDARIIPFQFRQMMSNLISNALKFTSPGQEPHITIKSEIDKGSAFHIDYLQPRKKYCHITVSDNGIGFEPEYAEKIFEVFQRLHGKDEYEGTGIGLAIVKKIVENHGGYIEAHGKPDEGATFDIYLPS